MLKELWHTRTLSLRLSQFSRVGLNLLVDVGVCSDSLSSRARAGSLLNNLRSVIASLGSDHEKEIDLFLAV